LVDSLAACSSDFQRNIYTRAGVYTVNSCVTHIARAGDPCIHAGHSRGWATDLDTTSARTSLAFTAVVVGGEKFPARRPRPRPVDGIEYIQRCCDAQRQWTWLRVSSCATDRRQTDTRSRPIAHVGSAQLLLTVSA